jgi:hypothetical protein
VSRIGSGSYVMGFVLADKQEWLPESSSTDKLAAAQSPYKDFVVLNTFEKLRNAVNSGDADFFMWEHFTSKRYYDSGEIRKVGEIYTPWSSWKIVASTNLVHPNGLSAMADARLVAMFDKLDQGIQHFKENPEEAIKYISTELDYSEEDAREWLKTVRFPQRTIGVNASVVDMTISALQKAGVLSNNLDETAAQNMIAMARPVD